MTPLDPDLDPGFRSRAAAPRLCLRALLCLGALLAPGAASGQEARAAVIGDTIRVGDVVPVAVRLTVGRGERVAWPDTLPLSGERVENAARVRERVDTLSDGRLTMTGIYAVTPWRTGDVPLPELSLDVVTGREIARTVTAALPSLEVVSVLPADTAGLEPMPAKGVIGGNWSWWSILLALLALAALIGAIVWWLRRRRAVAEAVPLEPPVPPRERVLARLEAAREAGLIEQGAMKEFYTRISDALRDYLAAIGPGWGEDLTTTELLGRFRAQVGAEEAGALAELLRPADQVKFARRAPDASVADREWQAVRTWVLEFDWPPRRAADEHGEAA